MDALAASAIAGINPLEFSRADPLDRALLMDVTNHAWELLAMRDEALARRIINELARAMGK